MLDIGCNSGHNAIHAATAYGMKATGIDVSPRHMAVSRFLAGVAGADATFLQESAETFSRPGSFDVVLHFGTLYHLPNPLLALSVSHGNLKPGGWLALETHTFDHPDDPTLCRFVHGDNNDDTNFWAISEQVLSRYLAFLGFTGIRTVVKATPAMLGPHEHRILMVAQKPYAS